MISNIIRRLRQQDTIDQLRDSLSNTQEALRAWKDECRALDFDLERERQQCIKLRGTLHKLKTERQDLRDRLQSSYQRNKRLAK